MKLVLAAPDSFLPSLPTALVVQVSRLHFFTKLVFAAPARGWPFFPIALDSQVPGCAVAEPSAKIDSKIARKKRFMFVSLVTFRWALSVPIPKFASACGSLSCELRNQRDTSNSMVLVPLLNPKFAIGLAARSCELQVRGTSRGLDTDDLKLAIRQVEALVEYRPTAAGR